MAELCGPSNALQNFQKHNSVDRTLQQDRHAPLQSPLEGFRENRAAESVAQAEFDAFINSKPPDPQLYVPSPFDQPLQHPTFQTEPAPSDWATDFQNLNLKHESPLPSSQFRQFAPPPSTSWREQFTGRAGSSSLSGVYAHQQQQQFQSSSTQQRVGPLTSLPYAAGTQFSAQPLMGQQAATEGTFDEAEAFAKAFQEAEQSFDSHVQQNQSQPKPKEQSQIQPTEPIDAEPISYRIGSDLISASSQKPHSSTDDHDELAKVAGNLLENVQGDTSAKFRNSNFLNLMRQLRDREVRVEGEKIVGVTQELHPGGSRYPQGGDGDLDQDLGQGEQPVFGP